jgi:hypothetical protein
MIVIMMLTVVCVPQAGLLTGAASLVEVDGFGDVSTAVSLQLDHLSFLSYVWQKRNLDRDEDFKWENMRVEGINSANSEAIFRFIHRGYTQINSFKKVNDISLCYWLFRMIYNKDITFLLVSRFQRPRKVTVQRLNFM